MKNKLKIITNTLLLTPLISTIALVSCSPGLNKEIVGQGSSSVSPIISKLNQESIYDIQYTANGSGKGYESQSATNPTSSFGMSSSLKYPKSTNSNVIKSWTDNKIRTTTFAIDAIAIVLNLPNTIVYPKNIRPIIDIQELSKLYDKDLSTTTSWNLLLKNAPVGASGLNQTPNTYGREGGKSASGTSDGFWHTLSKHMHSQNKNDADKNHNLLPKENQTPEANSQALNIVKKKENSLTYISLGYAMQNETNNSKVAIISNVGSGGNWIPSIANVKNGHYKWTRPFNIIYSTKNKKAVEFVKFLFEENTQKLIEDANFVPLSSNQKQSQLPLENSDVERGAILSKGDGNNMGLKIN